MNHIIHKNYNFDHVDGAALLNSVVKSSNRVSRVMAILVLLVMTSSIAFAGDDYQHKMLFEPDQYILAAEANGRIMIYDGLESETVERALDEEFDRIDNMMFVRIHHTRNDGGDYVEDDGCD